VTGHLGEAWARVDDAEDPRFYVRYLDASRAPALDAARRDPDAAFAHLGLRPGLSVLDGGCGTGEMLSLIAERVAPGTAVGVDASATMIAEAGRRFGARPGLSFHRADLHRLPFGDARFGCVMATQVLVHVPDPRAAVREMVRVAEPRGRVALTDVDWDTFTLASSDPDAGRRFCRLFRDGLRHPSMARQYGNWLREEGCDRVGIHSSRMAYDPAFVQRWWVQPSLEHFIREGSMTAAEAAALTADLEARSAAGTFACGATLYTVVGERS
jgi:ubiquinone/menaquinone biosynthesis C-methylase UbiE